eukprot:1472445-Amphidinium_carterae.1
MCIVPVLLNSHHGQDKQVLLSICWYVTMCGLSACCERRGAGYVPLPHGHDRLHGAHSLPHSLVPLDS